MKPLDLDFPESLTIEVPAHVRKALRQIADHEPHENDQRLLLRILSRGIVATFAAEIEREGDKKLEERLHSLQHGSASAEAPLNARAGGIYGGPGVRYRERHQEHLEQAERDIASANEPGEIEPGETRRGLAPRHMESYVASPISEKLRHLFEDYLNDHPGMTEEDALVTLVQLGLTHLDAEGPAVEHGAGPLTRKAEQRLHHAEKLYERAKRRCCP